MLKMRPQSPVNQPNRDSPNHELKGAESPDEGWADVPEPAAFEEHAEVAPMYLWGGSARAYAHAHAMLVVFSDYAHAYAYASPYTSRWLVNPGFA